MKYLKSQSTPHYELLKSSKGIYYIKRLSDNLKAKVGDRDEAELFILYGIEPNKEDLTTLNFK